MRMHTYSHYTPTRETDAFEISPALEMDPSASLSTYWMPLDELITHWTEVDLLLSHTPVAALLAAIGYALLALARESRALQRHTLAWGQRGDAPVHQTNDSFNRVGRSLHEAAHQWYRAAVALESLSPADLDPPVLERARRLARIARSQQQRLWALTTEVHAEVQEWRSTRQDSKGEVR